LRDIEFPRHILKRNSAVTELRGVELEESIPGRLRKEISAKYRRAPAASDQDRNNMIFYNVDFSGPPREQRPQLLERTLGSLGRHAFLLI
jgi:hypothetical protein